MVSDNVMGSKNKVNEHKCFPITKFKPGTLTKYGNIPVFDSIPSIVENFQGRQQEMCEVIILIANNRFVNILGPTGIGKTSFVRNLSNHLKDRNKFYDGILYINLKGCESAHMFLTRLSLTIQANGKINEDQLHQLRKISSKEVSGSDEKVASEEDQEKLRSFIIQMFKDKEVLLVLDGCEDPLEDDGMLFVKQLDNILGACPEIKMLLTSRKYVSKLEHTQEMPYHIYSLSPESSIRLLIDEAPREISNKEIHELLDYEIPVGHKIHQQFPSMRKGDVHMTNHPFILMFGGHPQAICLAAPLLENQSLKELFFQMLETNIMDALEGQQDNQPYASLRISLEISINSFKTKKPKALDLYMFIGLLPGGIKQKELTDMWGSNSWRSYKESLIRASLLVFKPQEDILILLPFMNTMAYELLEEEGDDIKNYFHFKWCRFYKEFCKNCLEKVGGWEFNMNEFVEKESNIWACIYRSINRKKYNNDYDLESNVWKEALFQSFNLERTQAFQKFAPLKGRENNQFSKPLQSHVDSNSVNEIQEDEQEDDQDDLQPISVSRFSSQNEIPETVESTVIDYSKINSAKKRPSRRDSNKTSNSRSGPHSQKTLPQFGTDYTNSDRKTKPSTDDSKQEELLVIYYVATAIRLSKISDGFKAIAQYKQKNTVSELTRAHIYKLLGVLNMLSEKKDYHKAKQFFNKAIKSFLSLECMRGFAVTKLALLK